jgi:hypothetical protein
MINIDHVDQATVYLSKTTLDVEILTTSTAGALVLRWFSNCLYNLKGMNSRMVTGRERLQKPHTNPKKRQYKGFCWF